MTDPARHNSSAQPSQEALAPIPKRSPAEQALVQIWDEQRALCRPLKFDAVTAKKAVELRARWKDPDLTQAQLAHAFRT